MEAGDKSKKPALEKAYQVIPDVGLLAKEVKEMGINKAIRNIKPVVGIPVLPMLAQRLKSPSEMIEKMGTVSIEPKFDGLRALIHFKRQKNGDEIKAYTRNLNNVYQMFPELKDVGKYLKADSVILDTEAVGMDPEMLYIANFQTTMKRRRKYDIEEQSRSIPLRFQTFDIIVKDGKNLMDLPYTERRKILEDVVIKNSLLVVDENLITEDPEIINSEYRKRIAEGLEGVVVKKADSKYVPGRTGWRWVKMKQEETSSAKLADTVDCVVMGYYSGRGKRAGFGIGGFLVGILDGEVIKTVTKIGTGLTDDQFREMYQRLNKLETKEKPKEFGEVGRTLTPHFWVEPSLVVEIAADEITKSPIHSAGYALRFPRLVKIRDDKSWEEATTTSELKKLFKLQ
jgi:DNA ligase-1